MNFHPDHVAPPVQPPPRRGIPGLDARNRGFSAALSPLVSMVFAAGFVLGAVLWPEFLQRRQAALLLFLIALGLFITWKRALLIFLRHEEGARGEEQVARVLDALPDQWQVFHGVPLGEKKLDHVLVGPDQVFSIETVHWRGPVRLVNGKLLHGDQHYPGYDLATLRTRGAELAAELGIPENALT
ncbi:MAG: nuclease-related domain-containing protein, partial [Kiritimatiellia bacterium]